MLIYVKKWMTAKCNAHTDYKYNIHSDAKKKIYIYNIYNYIHSDAFTFHKSI